MPCRLALLLAAVSLAAQNAPQPAFEIATLKLSPPPSGDLININLGTLRDGRLTLTNVTLSDLIKFAYELVSDDQLVPPAWNGSVRFDVEALVPPGTSPEQLHRMTQALLIERLNLRMRHETKVLPHLALLVGNNGPSFSAATGQTANPGPQVRGRIAHNQMPISLLVSLLSRFERQTIVDQTGLSGPFAIHLEWAPDLNLPAAAPTAAPSDRPSLFTAVREQLGLRLESRRGPLDVWIVEQASREPAPN